MFNHPTLDLDHLLENKTGRGTTTAIFLNNSKYRMTCYTSS